MKSQPCFPSTNEANVTLYSWSHLPASVVTSADKNNGCRLEIGSLFLCTLVIVSKILILSGKSSTIIIGKCMCGAVLSEWSIKWSEPQRKTLHLYCSNRATKASVTTLSTWWTLCMHTLCIFSSVHSSVSVSCFSSSAGGLLACRATGRRDIQLCLMCSQLALGDTVFTQTEVNMESVLFGHDSRTCRPFHSRWEADDSRWCVNLSAAVSAFLRRGGRKQVESFCILIQKAGCNFKSLIVILWHFTSPPVSFCWSESCWLKWGLDQYEIQMPNWMISPNSVSW